MVVAVAVLGEGRYLELESKHRQENLGDALDYKGNVFQTNAGTGGWGGSCTCPDGQVYQVGDNGNACGSLACIGGTPGQCKRHHGTWSRNKVTCGSTAATTAPREGSVTQSEEDIVKKAYQDGYASGYVSGRTAAQEVETKQRQKAKKVQDKAGKAAAAAKSEKAEQTAEKSKEAADNAQEATKKEEDTAKAKAKEAAEAAEKEKSAAEKANSKKEKSTKTAVEKLAAAPDKGGQSAGGRRASSGLQSRQMLIALRKAFGHCSKDQLPYSILLTDVQAWRQVGGKPLECPTGKYHPTEIYYQVPWRPACCKLPLLVRLTDVQVRGCGTSGSTFIGQIDCVCATRCCITDGKATVFASKFDAVATTKNTKSAYLKTMQTAYEVSLCFLNYLLLMKMVPVHQAYLEHRNALVPKMTRSYHQECGRAAQGKEELVQSEAKRSRTKRARQKSKGRGKGKKHVKGSTMKVTAGLHYAQTVGQCTGGPYWQSKPMRGKYQHCLYFEQLRSPRFLPSTKASCAKFCDEQIGCGAYSYSHHKECCVFNSSHHKGDGTPGIHCNIKGDWANRVEDHNQWPSAGADILAEANGTRVGGYYAERFITLLEETFNRVQTYARSQPHPSVPLSHTDRQP